MNNLIYLDNSATTKPFDEVINIMTEYMKTYYFNPSAAYRQGLDVSKRINESREIIAKAINASKDEIIFTSGGTEATNTAFKTILNNKKGHVITSAFEHDATLKTLESYKNQDIDVTYIKPNINKNITFEDIKKYIKEDTILISIMHVNNEIGSINDIETIGNEIKKINPNIIFHVDAVQSFMKLDISVKNSKVDMLSLSAHKINGPKGIGALYIAKNIDKIPLIYGGGQEKNYRSGTENVPGILGFAEAVKIHKENKNIYAEKYKNIKKLLVELLEANIEDFIINSPENSSDNIINISFLGVRSEILLNSLSARNILVSAGSACSSKKKSSHVLSSLGLTEDIIDSAIRISFGVETSQDDIEQFVTVLKEEIEDIRIYTKYKKKRGY